MAPIRDGEPPLAVPEPDPPSRRQSAQTRRQAVARLTARIRAIEGRRQQSPPALTDTEDVTATTARSDIPSGVPLRTGWRLGVEEIDRRLGPSGLETGALHEIKPAFTGHPYAATRDTTSDWASAVTAALAFSLHLSLRRLIGLGDAFPADQPGAVHTPQRTVLWCWSASLAQEVGGLHAPGLDDLGLDPAQMILVEPGKANDVLWAMEEGLKAPGLSLVVGALREVGLTPARRLALAASTHAVPCLLVTAPRSPISAATATRWRIGRAPSGLHPFAGRLGDALPGAPRYHVVLERSRTGHLVAEAPPVILEWSDASHCFRLAATPADRTLAEDRHRLHRR